MLNLIFSLEPLCGVRFAHEWHDPSMRSKHVLFLLHSNPGLLIGFSSLYFMGLLFFCCRGYLAAGNNEYKTTLVNKTPLMSIIMMGHGWGMSSNWKWQKEGTSSFDLLIHHPRIFENLDHHFYSTYELRYCMPHHHTVWYINLERHPFRYNWCQDTSHLLCYFLWLKHSGFSWNLHDFKSCQLNHWHFFQNFFHSFLQLLHFQHWKYEK